MTRVLWLLGCMGLGQPVWAENAEEASNAAISADLVRIQVWSVHATREGSVVDEELGDMARHLASLQYGGLSLLKKDAVALAVKGSKKIEVAGERSVRVSVLDRNPSRVRVRVQVFDPRGIVLDTTVAIRRNGFFIVAGPRYDGGMLVLPIFARY